MRIILNVIMLVFIIVNAQAQVDYGFCAYGGLGVINKTVTMKRDYQVYTSEYRPNWMLGIVVNYKLANKSSLELDVLYNQINTFFGKHEDGIISGQYIRISTENSERKCEYISFPLTYGLRVYKTRINIGFQNSFLISNTGYLYYSDFTGVTYKQYLKWEDINNMDFSFVALLSYSVSKNLLIEGRCNYGLYNTANNEIFYLFKLHSRQFLLGISYNISGIIKGSKNRASISGL